MQVTNQLGPYYIQIRSRLTAVLFRPTLTYFSNCMKTHVVCIEAGGSAAVGYTKWLTQWARVGSQYSLSEFLQ